MAFCIPASQYDESVHTIVSGPSTECLNCDFTQSSAQGSFFNLDFGGAGLRANSLPESLSFHATTQSLERQIANKISGNYLMAVARRGVKGYNNEWNFYLDPETFSFTDSPWMRYDLTPSDINAAFASGSMETIDVCFDISYAVKMDITGVLYCNGYFNLTWEAEKQQGPTGYTQCGTCLGNCPNGYEKSSDGTYETCVKNDPGIGSALQSFQKELDDARANNFQYANGLVIDIDDAISESINYEQKDLFNEIGSIIQELKSGGIIPS